MTTTYDPFHPKYFDEADLRDELVRVYDLCHGCRLCFKFCTSFPTMFAAIDQHDDQDAAKLTHNEQDQVVEECFNCKLCYVNCPYTPDQHEWNLDFPRLMLRADQVLYRDAKHKIGTRLANQALGRTDLVGKASTAVAPLANKAIGTPGSTSRKVMEKVTGIASQRLLPPYAKTRFSTWWKKRSALRFERKQGSVILFPTCLVEYQSPQVGKDLVRVLERNDVECSMPEGQVCCGAPWLHSGDVESFRRHGRKNVELLAGAIREATARGEVPAVVVPQPTCGYVLKFDYRDYIGGPDAELVAEHTADAGEYLMTLHRTEGTQLDMNFTGAVPETVTYHAPCHLRAQNIGLKSRDLIKLTGAKITVVAECSGIDGTWGYRAEHYDASRQVARKMVAAIDKAGNDVVAGDCHLANGGILQETGQQPLHPVSLLARAYDIPED
ncbi:MAG: heterodisulfide reductase-related iron-sulfur binding cluster [Acidimicrobiales bacterium]|nr:heterodisulfide reductase-related iron-sulfur binding cluster [Acidimicrobiales bacterium]